MATVNIQNLNSQIESLKKQAETSQDRLYSSPTAMGGEASPTSSDLQNQQELESIQKSIQKLTDEKLRAQWYPSADKTATAAETAGAEPGFFGSALDWISRPLYGVAGAAKHFLGQGKGSLSEDMAANILREKSTFGDILKTTQLPYAVTAPLGFALDVAMDPINWVTMGTAAIVPRLGAGVLKGVAKGSLAKGVSLAAKSGALQKATTVGRITPFFRKTGAFQKLGKASLETTRAWEQFAGTTAEELVKQRGFGVAGLRTGPVGEIIEKIGQAIPGGSKVLEAFKMDSHAWVKDARIAQILLDTFGSGTDYTKMMAAYRRGESIEPFFQEERLKFIKKMAETPVGPPPNYAGMEGVLSESARKELEIGMDRLAAAGLEGRFNVLAPKVVGEIDDAETLLKNPQLGIAIDPIERIRRMEGEIRPAEAIMDDIARIVESGALGETGIRWFDNMTVKIRNFRSTVDANDKRVAGIGQKVMDKYDQAMAIFRVAKVGASPTTWMNAVVGNLIMTHMALGGISGTFMRRLKQTYDFNRKKSGSLMMLDDILRNAEVDTMHATKEAFYTETMSELAKHRMAMGATTGTTLEKLSGGKYNSEIFTQFAKEKGLINKSNEVDLKAQVKAAIAELNLDKDELASIGLKGTEEGGLTRAMKEIKLSEAEGRSISQLSMGTGMGAQELMKDRAGRLMLLKISENAKKNPDNLGWKVLDLMLNKASSGYEKIDQTYKFASIINSVVDGYTTNQLRNLRHIIEINPEEMARYSLNGRDYYRLPVETAIELANVQYMNYAAMPAAIRVLRNFPLLGSPFASFMFGMAIKTGQTAIYNPSAFTKVNWALRDFGGTKTPFEKKAQEGQYYSYLNRPGMFRLPGEFFDVNPVYLNLTNMIPYYSMNMFNPSEVNYHTDALPASFVSLLEKSPLLKDPIGATLFDYLIQPMILGEAIAPQGQFGQALYPVGAGAGTKALYGLRTLSEAFTPNVLAMAGAVTPESVAPYIPSYRWRSLAMAKYGKNPLGITGKESAASRVARNVASVLGLPVQAPMNLTYVKRENK